MLPLAYPLESLYDSYEKDVSARRLERARLQTANTVNLEDRDQTLVTEQVVHALWPHPKNKLDDWIRVWKLIDRSACDCELRYPLRKLLCSDDDEPCNVATRSGRFGDT